jgi:hypothetical protein
MVIPVLESLDIAGKTLTTDALLTQRKLATYAVERKAHYVFTVKANQPTLHEAIQLAFADRQQPDFRESPDLAHGRIEQRSIWTSTRLNDYLDFPGVGQVFLIERHVIEKKTGKTSTDLAFGLTSHTPQPPVPPACWRIIVAIGPLKTAATTPSTGIGMRIAPPSAPVTAQRISLPCAVLPPASSNPELKRVSPRPSNGWDATSVWSSTICA